MDVCPTKELLERYLAGRCPADERQLFEDHLTQCDDCREQIEATQSLFAQAGRSDSKRFGADADDEATLLLAADQRPTESLGEVTVVTPGKQDFTKSVESMIEGYKIVETLPRGGQAVVYKAVHLATKTNVAIKVLLPTLLASDRARYYFEREAELIATLDHPNIVSIRDSGIIHHQYYFVMQYIDGEPLRRYVQAQRLSFRERVELLKKICTAITYAHQQGIIHRDLKFANIMVDKRGEPHILDFGLAKAIGMDDQADDKAVATMTGQWSGSLSTMSPEQAAGQPNMIDVRTDVYSLGVILYTLLTGQYPYDVAGPTLEALKNIQQTQPTRPRQIVPKFNSEMEAILLTTLEKQREKRYQSTAELQSDIENWLQGRPIRVKSISTIYLLKKIIGRHRYTSTVVALLAMIIVAFAWISFELFKQSEKARQASETDLKNMRAVEGNSRKWARQMTFSSFLQAWHVDWEDGARRATTYMTLGSREHKATAFLLDRRPLEDKEPEFRQSISQDHPGFADLILGEYHLKRGELDKALKTYESGYNTIRHLRKSIGFRDNWLEIYITSRLYEVRSKKKSTGKTTPPDAKGPKT